MLQTGQMTDLFGDGWHLFGIGSSAYTEAADEFTSASDIVNGYIDAASEQGIDTDAVAEALDTESEDFDPEVAKAELAAFVEDVKNIDEIEYTVVDEETMADEEDTATYDDLLDSVWRLCISMICAEPDPADYGVWVPGIPVLVGNGLDAINCADWLKGLILDGIVAGVGAVLGFVPQMLVLFILLAIP